MRGQLSASWRDVNEHGRRSTDFNEFGHHGGQVSVERASWDDDEARISVLVVGGWLYGDEAMAFDSQLEPAAARVLGAADPDLGVWFMLAPVGTRLPGPIGMVPAGNPHIRADAVLEPLQDRHGPARPADGKAARHVEAPPNAPVPSLGSRRPAGGRHRIRGRHRHAVATTPPRP